MHAYMQTSEMKRNETKRIGDNVQYRDIPARKHHFSRKKKRRKEKKERRRRKN